MSGPQHIRTPLFDDYAYGNFTNWRTTWALIVPGHSSDSIYSDLLFYDPGAGLISLFHTDQNGFVDYAYKDYFNQRTTWSIITPVPFATALW